MNGKIRPEVGSAELLQEYPIVRASYSSSPGFKIGAEEPHPIDSPEKSLLVRPEIAEALEASHRSTEKTGEGDLSDIDLDLARTGLKWLRNNLDEDLAPVLRRQVINTKSGIASEERAREDRIIEERRQEEARKEKALKEQAEADSRVAAEAEQAEAEARQQAFYDELELALTKLEEESPELMPDGLLGLGKHIELTKDMGEPSNGFETALDRRVAEYLRDPDELANDIMILSELNRRYRPSSDADTVSPVKLYARLLTRSIDEALPDRHYAPKDLNPEVVKKWLDIFIDAYHAREIEDTSIVIRGSNTTPSVGRALDAYGSEIFENTIRSITHDNPEKLVDILYMIAEQGLDPEDDVLTEVTTGLIRHFLVSQNLPMDIIQSAGASRDIKTQRKAIDLLETLKHVDPAIQRQSQPREVKMRKDRYSEVEIRIIESVYKRYFKAKHGLTAQTHIQAYERYQENIRNFLEWATNSKEGKSSTIYGSFA